MVFKENDSEVKSILDEKIKDANIKSQLQNPMSKHNIELIEKEFYVGINVDKTLSITMDGAEIGRCAVSEMSNSDEIYLEWLEFSYEYQGKHLLRPTLLAIGNYLNVNHFIFEAGGSSADKYLHLGATTIEFDDVRLMSMFKLSVSDLENNSKQKSVELKGVKGGKFNGRSQKE